MSKSCAGHSGLRDTREKEVWVGVPLRPGVRVRVRGLQGAPRPQALRASSALVAQQGV